MLISSCVQSCPHSCTSSVSSSACTSRPRSSASRACPAKSSRGKILLPQIYLILPLVVLVYMIMIGFTMATAAVYATLYCVVVAMISREEGKKKLVMAIP